MAKEEKVRLKQGTVAKACSCKSEYQDAKYGKDQRIHNRGLKGQLTCTVCGSVKK